MAVPLVEPDRPARHLRVVPNEPTLAQRHSRERVWLLSLVADRAVNASCHALAAWLISQPYDARYDGYRFSTAKAVAELGRDKATIYRAKHRLISRGHVLQARRGCRRASVSVVCLPLP